MKKMIQSHYLFEITLFKRSTLIVMLLFTLGNVFGQFTIKGTITDSSGYPLIGASILLKGTSTGTITDINGNYTLISADSSGAIVISYTGFATQEIAFGTSKQMKRKNKDDIIVHQDAQVIDMALEEDAAQLSEVVVTGYGIAKEKKSMGSSVSSIPLNKNRSNQAYTPKRQRAKKKKDKVIIRGQSTIKEQEEVKVADVLKGKASGVTIATDNASKTTKAESPQNAFAQDKIIIRPNTQTQNPNKPVDTKTLPQNPTQNSGEGYELIQENEFLAALQNPLSTFSIDVDAASYSNMRRYILGGQAPPKDAIRIEEMINYFNYEYPNPSDEHPFEVITEISECPWNADNRLVHIGLQGKDVAWEDLPASNTVFLIDVSGSMSASNKLPLLKSSFKMLVDQLRPQDRVAMVVYAGAAGMVLESTPGDQKQKIKTALRKLSAGGSTAGGAGIKLAYKTARDNFIEGGNNRVILATDGDFNVGVSGDGQLVRMIEKERESGVFLTILGFGTGNYQDAKMQKLANHGNGNHAYIDNIQEAKKVLVEEFGGTMFAIAKDVKIQIEFNPSKVQGYRLIGYENRMLAAEDFNNDAKDAGELGAGHTVTALYEIIPKGVNSEFVQNVDELKYQTGNLTNKGISSKELMTIKLRYKAPDGDVSQLIEAPVIDAQVPLQKTTNNFRWSASVAQFGMLLRDSKFKGKSTYADCLRLANEAKGYDLNNYRTEMINLIERMRGLVDPQLAGK